MGTYLDILGGFFVMGFLLLIAFRASDTATTEFFNYNSDAIVQQNIAQLSGVIQYDLRKMGYGIPESQQSTILQIAQPSHLKFLAHLNGDTECRIPLPGNTVIDDVPDTIEYVVQPLETINYGDTSITTYRVTRKIKISTGYSENMMVGVIGNSNVFNYLDQIGNPVPMVEATKMIEVTLTAFNPRVVLSPDYISEQISGISDPQFRRRELRRLLRASFWKQTRLISKNLRR